MVVGSRNPAKAAAVRWAFHALEYPVDVVPYSVPLPDSIPEMPIDDQVREGAIVRARLALDLGEGCFGVGLEGGVTFDGGDAYLLNWAAVRRFDGVESAAPSARLKLPEDVADAIRAGFVLGQLMVERVGRDDVNEKEGAIGFYTGGLLSRSTFFHGCLACALAPFMNPKAYGLPLLGGEE